MIIIEGDWKSQVNENLQGNLSVTINVDRLYSDMTGHVKIIHSSDHQCINNVIEFVAEIKYERNSELIFNGQRNIIDRLFIRQKNFGKDIYYTMQLTSYNGGLWQGSYTSIYPNDLGDLSDLQFIMNCEIAYDLADVDIDMD